MFHWFSISTARYALFRSLRGLVRWSRPPAAGDMLTSTSVMMFPLDTTIARSMTLRSSVRSRPIVRHQDPDGLFGHSQDLLPHSMLNFSMK